MKQTKVCEKFDPEDLLVKKFNDKTRPLKVDQLEEELAETNTDDTEAKGKM